MTTKNIEIQDHNGDVYHPHTDAKVVFRNNGKTVEESLSANETSILKLEEQLGGQISRAKNILTSLSSKVE